MPSDTTAPGMKRDSVGWVTEAFKVSGHVMKRTHMQKMLVRYKHRLKRKKIVPMVSRPENRKGTDARLNADHQTRSVGAYQI